MSAYYATVRVEAANARTACHNAHKAYNILAKDVASNVSTRKQVYIASKVIMCYVDNLKNNGAANSCAGRARGANTSRWNITPAKMSPCLSKAQLEAQIGPMTWRPSKKNCHYKHWNEREIKAKERADKERSTKEKQSKERTAKERNTKERNTKEKNNKQERANKAVHERNHKNAVKANRLKVSRHYR